MLEFFLERVREWGIESLEVLPALIDEDEAARGQDKFAFATQLAHTIDVQLEFDSFSPKDKVLTSNSMRISIGRLWRIQCHILNNS